LRPAAKGAALGLGAAVLFGMATPAAKYLLDAAGPITLAGLLYVGGGLGVSLLQWRQDVRREAPLRRADFGMAALILVLGGIVAPIALLYGLQGTTAASASLLLNLEGPLTVLVAAVFFREYVGWRLGLSVMLVFAGAGLLGYVPAGEGGESDWRAVLLIAVACLCWALDNNLTQRLTLKNPVTIVQIKTLGAGGFNLFLAWMLGESMPAIVPIILTLAVGFLSYGISILMDAYALRILGAAREAAFFATAPFIGVAGSVVLLGENFGVREGAAFALMTAGIGFLLTERHEHLHVHEPLEHEHLHFHDEHHQHVHDGRVTEPHSHWHRHERLVHSHLHVPDVHHRHSHRKKKT
jgi:drug/metabolite transporter (DMT)-like permease